MNCAVNLERHEQERDEDRSVARDFDGGDSVVIPQRCLLHVSGALSRVLRPPQQELLLDAVVRPSSVLKALNHSVKEFDDRFHDLH